MDEASSTNKQLLTPDCTPQRPARLHTDVSGNASRAHGIPFHVMPTRHRKTFKDNMQASLNKPVIRRLARRGGVIRISTDIYEAARVAIRKKLEEILSRAVQIVELRRQKTVTALDIVYVLKGLGSPLYGFGSVEEIGPKSRAEAARLRRDKNRQNAMKVEARVRADIEASMLYVATEANAIAQSIEERV